MKYKYIALDFGKVIAAPTTGNWDITPKFLELIDINKIGIDKFKELRKQYGNILSEKITTLEEEYDMFIRFYEPILNEFGYSKDIVEKIAYDRTYSFDKYTLYDNIHDELKVLNEMCKKYKLKIANTHRYSLFDWDIERVIYIIEKL